MVDKSLWMVCLVFCDVMSCRNCLWSLSDKAISKEAFVTAAQYTSKIHHALVYGNGLFHGLNTITMWPKLPIASRNVVLNQSKVNFEVSCWLILNKSNHITVDNPLCRRQLWWSVAESLSLSEKWCRKADTTSVKGYECAWDMKTCASPENAGWFCLCNISQ